MSCPIRGWILAQGICQLNHLVPPINYSQLLRQTWHGVHSIACPHNTQHHVTAQRLQPSSVTLRHHPTATWMVHCHDCRRKVSVLTVDPPKQINTGSTARLSTVAK